MCLDDSQGHSFPCRSTGEQNMGISRSFEGKLGVFSLDQR